MRILTALLLLLPVPALSDVFSPASSITDVTVYPDSAAITRKAPFSVPAGRHQLILRDLPRMDDIMTLRVRAEGAQIGAIVYRESFVPPDGLPTPPEIETAETLVENIEQRILAVQDDASHARLAIKAADSRLQFLNQLGGDDAITSAGLETLKALSQMIAQDALDANQTALAAEIQAREIERALKDLNEELDAAQQALAAVSQESEDRIYVSVEVISATPTKGTLILSYLAGNNANWVPTYDLMLNRGDNASVAIQRDAMVVQQTGENWTDVNLTLSTLEPYGQIEPSRIWPDYRRITDPVVDQGKRDSMVGRMAEPVTEAPVILTEDSQGFSASHDGLGVTYQYPVPVSIASEADVKRLKLGTLDLDAKMMAIAIPWADNTAFLAAEITNDTGEEILAAPVAMLYVDGVFVGETAINAIPVGATARLPFGPIDGLRLKTVRLDAGEGETGFVSRYNQQRQHTRLEIENLSDQHWDVRLLGRVPYSEQDELKILWKARPHPTEIDIKDEQGILGWDLSLAPGDKQSISIRTEMTWPQDKVLQ